MSLTLADLTLEESAPGAELLEFYVNLLQTHFASSSAVHVDIFMEDFNPENVKDLYNRAQQGTVVLYDMPAIDPVLDDEKRTGNTRLSVEDYKIGWYICAASNREDQGKERIIEALKVMSRVQRLMASVRVSYTSKSGSVDAPDNSVLPRPIEIEKLSNVHKMVIYEVMYKIRINRDLSL